MHRGSFRGRNVPFIPVDGDRGVDIGFNEGRSSGKGVAIIPDGGGGSVHSKRNQGGSIRTGDASLASVADVVLQVVGPHDVPDRGSGDDGGGLRDLPRFGTCGIVTVLSTDPFGRRG